MISTSWRRAGMVLALCAAAAGCSTRQPAGTLPPVSGALEAETLPDSYIIGPLDSLQIFVWRNPELSTNVSVRPDGRITIPLISDLPAAGKTPAQLADDIKARLAEFINTPVVQVIVGSFSGPLSQQVRVVGAAARPQAIPYRANMMLLDVMIATGGLTEFAAGNRARLIRTDKATGARQEFNLQISRLLKDGDSSANVRIEPGDVIIIPESVF
jgi:polysaccharide export outer membrane protein